MPPTGGRRDHTLTGEYLAQQGGILDEAIAKGFGVVLRRLRLERGMTQEVLGMEAGTQRKHVSALELGDKQPTLTTIFALARALHVPPGRVLNLVEHELAGSNQ